jgi:hypothetical protein
MQNMRWFLIAALLLIPSQAGEIHFTLVAGGTLRIDDLSPGTYQT